MKPVQEPPRLLTPEEVCRALSIGKSHLLNQSRLGKLGAVKIGGRWRYRRAVVESLLGENLHASK